MKNIKKMPKLLEDRFFANREQVKNFETVLDSSCTVKRPVASAKENYSAREKKWFEEFCGHSVECEHKGM